MYLSIHEKVIGGYATLERKNRNQTFVIMGMSPEGILAHSSQQNCCNSVTLEDFQA